VRELLGRVVREPFDRFVVHVLPLDGPARKSRHAIVRLRWALEGHSRSSSASDARSSA
jgi:hypothetical protein